MPNFLRTLAYLLAIPVLGYLVATGILWDLNKDVMASAGTTFDTLCAARSQLNNAELNTACGEIASIQMLKQVSSWCAVAGVALPLLALFAASYAGQNRARLARVFRPLVMATVALLAGLVLVEACVLAFAAYEGESYLIGRVHYFVIGFVALGGLIAALQLAASAFQFVKAVSFPVIGKLVTRESEPGLFKALDETAERVSARVPDNVVMGLDPTFFATSADVRLIGHPEQLKGETLYLSAPLARILTEEELRSVIGHELGHFSGQDTAYSLRFAPVYAGLGSSLQAVQMGEQEGAAGLAKLPALALLGYIHGLFHRAESGVSRERELAADAAGAKAGTALALGTALCKICVYSQLWPTVRQQSALALADGHVTRNLSLAFADSARFDVEAAAAEQLLGSVLDVRVAHPTDSHPPVSQRLESLKVSIDEVRAVGLALPSMSAIQLLQDSAQLEAELTTLEHRVQLEYGHVVMPKEPRSDDFERAIYHLIASVIRADGKIEASEVLTAEAIGQKLLKDTFRPLAFREICSHQPDDFDALALAKALSSSLTDEGRQTVMTCLTAVAQADGEVAPREQALLASIEQALKEGASAAADAPTEAST